MTPIICRYQRVRADTLLDNGAPVQLVADCEQFGDTVLTIWHESTMATMRALGFDAEEYVGAIEAAEERFWERRSEGSK